MIVVLSLLLFSFSSLAGDFAVAYERFIDILPSIAYSRGEAIEFFNEMEDKLESETHLTGGDMDLIHQGVVERSIMRNKLLGLVEHYRKEIRFQKFKHKPTVKQFKKVLLALSVGFTLMDSYVTTAVLYQNNRDLRRIVNNGNVSFNKEKDELLQSTELFYSSYYSRLKRRAIKIYELGQKLYAEQLVNDDQYIVLNTLISSSVIYQVEKELEGKKKFKYNFKRVMKRIVDGHHVSDRFERAYEGIIFGISKAYGRTLGLVQFRKGYLYQNKECEEDVLAIIKPMDILYDKINAKINDKLIPGFWGHTAIWIGNEEQLKELGIWEHESIKPLHNTIRAGNSIVEGLGDGVNIYSVEHFLNIDDVALAHHKSLTKQQTAEGVLRAVAQIGKKYDFAFDAETNDYVTCSEVVFNAYSKDFDFKLDRVFGRWMVSPDTVASESFPGGAFEVTLFWHNGEKLEGDLSAHMERIVSAANDE